MRFFARACLAVMTLLPLACTAADKPQFELGKDYQVARQPQPTADPGKIEVMEVFAYSCPHCFHLEGEVQKWLAKKPADVAFVRAPHTLGAKAAEFRNKAFYSAQMLGVAEPFHKALFGAIHGQMKLMATKEEVRALFVSSTGVKAEEFDGAYDSFAIDSRFRIGEAAIQELGIASVPTVVVVGKYLVKNGAQVFASVDFLVNKARQERKSH
jgi:protein dithiol oxidoreductase (disulfide-forming)